MKGDMEVEVLTEPMDYRARSRMEKMVMTPEEQELFCYCPNAARGNKRPGFPADDDSGYGDSQ